MLSAVMRRSSPHRSINPLLYSRRYIHSPSHFLHRSTPLLSSHNTLRAHNALAFRQSLFRFQQQRGSAFTTGGRIMWNAMRIPLAGVTAAAGGLTFLNYKVNEYTKSGQDFIRDIAGGVKNVTDSVRDRVNELELPNVEVPDFFKNLFASKPNDTPNTDSSFSHSYNKNSSNSSPSSPSDPSALALAAEVDEAEEHKKSKNVLKRPTSSGIQPHGDDFMMLTRKLIEVRGILQSIDHAEQLKLPSIVVIGSQSSGKSSVLEAIVGHEFLPKGSNMVTRRPIELTLIHTPQSKEEYGEFPQLGLGKIYDFRHIQETLRDLNLAVPEHETVSNSPIELRIYSANVPDLTLIDLPGYIQIHGKGQSATLRDDISQLCEKYIREPNIILAVCAADVDLANSPALNASHRVDPLGLRTIGVVTKMDLIDPKEGVTILNNKEYPLPLGYVGVVCKRPTTSALSGKNITGELLKSEERFFQSHTEYRSNNVRVGTAMLRSRLMQVLEEAMGRALFPITDAVKRELEETRYQFKVQYNDRLVTADSYVAEAVDTLKHQLRELAQHFARPQVLTEIKQMLQQRVLDICAEVYWSDPRIHDMNPTNATANSSNGKAPGDEIWQHKLEVSASALTKSGIGRATTELVVDILMANAELVASSDPFRHHPETRKQVLQIVYSLLRERYLPTSEQVENCIKPYKYEVELTPKEWNAGRDHALELVEAEIRDCASALKELKASVGKSRLQAAIKYVTDLEKKAELAQKGEGGEEKRSGIFSMISEGLGFTTGQLNSTDAEAAESNSIEAEEARAPPIPPRLLQKAREVLFLHDRLSVLRMRHAVLRSRACRRENREHCPEAFLTCVSEKLANNAAMMVWIEMLNEFYFELPRAVEERLVRGASQEEIRRMALENEKVKDHLALQEKKKRLELAMRELNELVRRYQERRVLAAASSSGNSAGAASSAGSGIGVSVMGERWTSASRMSSMNERWRDSGSTSSSFYS
ncbi:uncharacterized protein VTP21DRAFT_5784 [Calcarisporiella thermophila]|uniref:uncharacterized protein n=1 Tax=Calcarisporiella thermophila TaxID=911321 RepID=UPI00374466AF